MSKKKLLTVLAGLASLCLGVNAAELNAYSVMPEKYASRIFAEFTKDTGIKVNFLRFSTFLRRIHQGHGHQSELPSLFHW